MTDNKFPKTKLQRLRSTYRRSLPRQPAFLWKLGIGNWDFFGIWSLKIGSLPRSLRVGTSDRLLLRIPLDKRLHVAVEPTFPLTLTLSLGEREQQPTGVRLAHTGLANSVAVMAGRRRTILPLPGGEGRGEGNENVAYPTAP